MEKSVKIPYLGRSVDGVEMDFKTINEEWNEYQISDGSTIRIKLVMTNIVKLSEEVDRDGTPVYVAKTSNVMAASLPGATRKRTVN